jgi:hypothetical protein
VAWQGKITFVAPIIRQAIATLEADLPAAIVAFNAEANVQLTMPTSFEFGAADPLILTEGPVIEVSVPSGQSDGFSIGHAEWDHNPRLNVCVWHEGDRGQLATTYEMSLGLARCVIEVLSRDAALGDQVDVPKATGALTWRADVIPEDPTAEGRDFRKWRVPVLLQFALETVERVQT